ncbi:MAG: bacillithiol biosynthesis cysteine-adding enzyme BshC [Ilyomonas sp.]
MKQYINNQYYPLATAGNAEAADNEICKTIPYQQTNYFSKTVTDYLDKNELLKPFYKYSVSLEGIEEAIEARKQFPQNRKVLVEELKKQYADLSISEKTINNIQLLAEENTFTITTAHQPNIFTGPLYFIYKILHAVKLAESLSRQFSQYNFVPVYYMGSEDADLDELNHIKINGQEYKWNTKQTGAVGRMKVDKAFIELIDKIEGQIGVEKYGEELASLFKASYRIDATIQQATLELVNALFSEFGLVVLNPDNAELKCVFNCVVKKELTQQFSHKVVRQTLQQLGQHYKVQAGGREINLFYLIDNRRERIEVRNGKFLIQNSELAFTEEEILKEVDAHPERFSGNVILRGVFQETVLPNIAFIGGGGELAYWLELKNVFEAVDVPYPVLILRNSFLLIEPFEKEKINKLGFELKDVFLPKQDLLNNVVKRETSKQLTLTKETEQAKTFYRYLKNIAGEIDTTLQQHIDALETKAVKKLVELEKKMLRAERKKFEAEERQIHKLKDHLFPNNSLQERTENVSSFYARFGKELLQILYKNSPVLEQEFTLLVLP